MNFNKSTYVLISTDEKTEAVRLRNFPEDPIASKIAGSQTVV